MHPASWPTYLSQDRWRSGHSTVDGFRMSGCSVTGALALALAPRATEFSVTFLEDGDERCGSLSEMWSVRFERVACRRLRDRRAGRTDGGHIDPLARGWRRRGVDRPVQPSGPPQPPRPGPGHPRDPARLRRDQGPVPALLKITCARSARVPGSTLNWVARSGPVTAPCRPRITCLLDADISLPGWSRKCRCVRAPLSWSCRVGSCRSSAGGRRGR